VVSSTLESGAWHNSNALWGDVVEEVTKLRLEVNGDVVVHGSAQLAQSLLANDLVDELRLMVFPVVLGSGTRLFGPMEDKKRFALQEAKTVGDGVNILIFTPSPLA
jgi:dihydrofolate reductase